MTTEKQKWNQKTRAEC